MKPILEVKGLWKQYHRGAQQERYLSVRDSLVNVVKSKAKKEKFWALQDINFEVNAGDSLAIIGKNGAGKSTLLKLLSRITPPTRGEIVLRGRLASLLEVGTGFHPELTGRENIYLNGSILGLGRAEISRQFDAIVDFSGVADFLDTPLKHYSSGMQLRLAFAVAAHLEPEILVIDEVLAVGDSTFQQKCIAKMTEVSRSGRTLLFVSHNVQAINNLCQKAILLESGCLTTAGLLEPVLAQYLDTKSLSDRNIIECGDLIRKGGKRELYFTKLKFSQIRFRSDETFSIILHVNSHIDKKFSDLLFGLNIYDKNETCVYHLSNAFLGISINEHKSNNCYKLSVPSLRLRSGRYSISLFLRANEEIQDWINDAAVFEVIESNPYGFSNTSMITGLVFTDFSFETITGNDDEQI